MATGVFFDALPDFDVVDAGGAPSRESVEATTMALPGGVSLATVFASGLLQLEKKP